MPAVAELLKHAEATRRIIRAKYGHLTGNDLLDAAIEENVSCRSNPFKRIPPSPSP